MSIAALHSYLSSKSTVTNNVGARIYRSVVPQSNSVWPCLVLNLITEKYFEDLQGDAGMKQCRFQIDCYSTDPNQTDAVMESVRLVVQGYAGQMGTLLSSSSSLANAFSAYHPPADATDVGLYRTSHDYLTKFYI